jgi:endo-1,4-beta-xylanase
MLWGAPRVRFWYDRFGTEVVDRVFVWAHETAPHVRLRFTEDNVLLRSIDDAARQVWEKYVGFLEHFKAAGIPVDVAEIENNFSIFNAPTRDQMVETLRDIQALGYDIGGGEITVSIADIAPGAAGLGARQMPSDRRQAQAELYRDVVDAYLEVGAPLGLGGFTDRHSWLDEVTTPGSTKAMLIDADYRPKPAYFAVRDVLKAKAGLS